MVTQAKSQFFVRRVAAGNPEPDTIARMGYEGLLDALYRAFQIECETQIPNSLLDLGGRDRIARLMGNGHGNPFVVEAPDGS